MYIKDGSSFDYDARKSIPNRYSWGWLGDSVPTRHAGWSTQQEKQRVLARLKEITQAKERVEQIHEVYDKPFHDIEKYAVMHHCGWHVCEICAKTIPITEIDSTLGWNGSIIIKHNSMEFRCPWAVEHYVEMHDYNPGPIVIDALFNGTLLRAVEYDKAWDKEREIRLKKFWEEQELEQKRIEDAKSPEQKAYEAWAKKKVKKLLGSSAMIDCD